MILGANNLPKTVTYRENNNEYQITNNGQQNSYN